jgi:hypothetical protein
LSCLHADNIKTFNGQAKEKVLAHRTRFKTNTFNRMWKFHKAFSDITDYARHFSLEQHRSLAIHSVKSTESQQHI